jgi:hypothetical protein
MFICYPAVINTNERGNKKKKYTQEWKEDLKMDNYGLSHLRWKKESLAFTRKIKPCFNCHCLKDVLLRYVKERGVICICCSSAKFNYIRRRFQTPTWEEKAIEFAFKSKPQRKCHILKAIKWLCSLPGTVRNKLWYSAMRLKRSKQRQLVSMLTRSLCWQEIMSKTGSWRGSRAKVPVARIYQCLHA